MDEEEEGKPRTTSIEVLLSFEVISGVAEAHVIVTSRSRCKVTNEKRTLNVCPGCIIGALHWITLSVTSSHSGQSSLFLRVIEPGA